MAAQHVTFGNALRAYVQTAPFAAQATSGVVTPAAITAVLPQLLPPGWDGITPFGQSIIGVVAYTGGMPTTVAVAHTGATVADLRQRYDTTDFRNMRAVHYQAARRIREDTGMTALVYAGSVQFRDFDSNVIYPGLGPVTSAIPDLRDSIMTIVQSPTDAGFWLAKVSVAARRFHDASESSFLNSGRYFVSGAPLGSARLEFAGYARLCPAGGITPSVPVSGSIPLQVLTYRPINQTSTSPADRISTSGPAVAVLDAVVCIPITPIMMRGAPAPADLLPPITYPRNTAVTSSTACRALNVWQQTAARTVRVGPNTYTIAVAALETTRTASTVGAEANDASGARVAVAAYTGAAPSNATISAALPPGNGGSCVYSVGLSSPAQTIDLFP
jgi:hypothetical protein